tara:strand:+ start:417 stop:1229 length:813 start_codon:yes stop_codon:yes gene_type:complete
MEFNIKGHSGCKLQLKGDRIIKTASNKNYSDRLFLQYDKQLKFKNKIISTPKIYNKGKDAGCFWFEMQMMPFKTFDYLMLISDKTILDVITKKIVNFINGNINNNRTINSDILINKYEDTKNKIFIRHGIDVNYLNNLFYDLAEEIEIPVGYCHGDLTFSNMLFNNSNIVFIDFLDTFLDTPLQDIVKIRQDTRYYWSLNLVNKVHDRVKIKQSLNYMDKLIEKEFSKYEFYRKYYKHFQVLNLLRILPYSNNKKHIDKLMKEIRLLCLL